MKLTEAALVVAIFTIVCTLVFPVKAEEPVCKWTLDATTPALTEPFRVIDKPEDVAKSVELLREAGAVVPEGVTRILLALIDGQGFYGLEVGGCLLAPVVLPPGLAPAAQRLSGRYSFGTFA
jgi:hypothetical protein